MQTTTLRNGVTIPRIGLGTWAMGERAGAARDEVKALQLGIDLGMTLIDTAEMYGEGGAERVVGEAIAGRRDGIYLVSKVYPHNASRAGAVAACERSLQRLGTERLDLYLLHWPGSEPLAETVAGFEHLVRQGKIGAWGVSNFDTPDMAKLATAPAGVNCVSNQVLYHLGERGIEWQLLPDCQKAGIMVMAYSPLGQAAILDNPVLVEVALKHDASAAAVALAFLLRQKDVVVIPKSATSLHVRNNATAAAVSLEDADVAAIERAYPPPKRSTPLAML